MKIVYKYNNENHRLEKHWYTPPITEYTKQMRKERQSKYRDSNLYAKHCLLYTSPSPRDS